MRVHRSDRRLTRLLQPFYLNPLATRPDTSPWHRPTTRATPTHRQQSPRFSATAVAEVTRGSLPLEARASVESADPTHARATLLSPLSGTERGQG